MLRQIPLKRIIWDYDVDADELSAFLDGKEKQFHHFTREMLYVRILERLSWYEILECMPISLIRRMLNLEIISMLRSESMRRGNMITPQEYYTNRLYPLQDGIIRIVNKVNTPFYLTGGTALENEDGENKVHA